MKDQSELKDMRKTIRLTEEQYQTLCKRGKEAKMSWSSYMLAKAIHGNGITPEFMVKFQNLISFAASHSCDPDAAEYIRKEADKLWSSLN